MPSLPAEPSSDDLESRGHAFLLRRDYPAAEAALREAIAAGATRASVHLKLGLALSAQGKLAEAAVELATAVRGAPDDPAILLHLGIALSSQGRHAEAERAFREAAVLDPFNFGMYLNLGNALAEQGKAEEALACYRKALALRPDVAATHYNVGAQLKRMDRLEEATDAYRTAVELEPAHKDAHNNLGIVYQHQGRMDEAVTCYRRVLELDPNHAQARNNLGMALRAREQFEQAAAVHERAIQLRPDHPDAYVHLGDTRADQGRYAEAQLLYEKALSLGAAGAQVHNNLGNALSAQHRWDDAIAQYQRMLQLEPASPHTRYNLGLARLFRHEFETGWIGYEDRLNCAEVRKGLRKEAGVLALYERLPRWRGPAEPGAGEVAIWSEQGIGDQVLFSTLIPDLRAAGVPFVYEVDGRLLKAYERAFPDARFVALESLPHRRLQQASRVLLAGSLPGLFRASRGNFAEQPEKLLGALPERADYYRDRLTTLGAGLKVALSWKSRHRQVRLGPRKSRSLTEFAPLLRQPDVHFIDVQYGDTAAERAAAERETGTRLFHFDEVDCYHDLEELLAILEACDLLVTTSNATAHLAGALGKRTWLVYLEDRAPFYYWAHGGGYRSLWYPSVEIVTARHLTQWTPLVEQVAARLSRERA